MCAGVGLGWAAEFQKFKVPTGTNATDHIERKQLLMGETMYN